MIKAAIYTRYSTDLQSESSIEDQEALCRRFAEARGWQVVTVYADRAQSGASAMRDSFRQMQADASCGRFEIILCEALDRLSRNLADIADLHQRMEFQQIRIVTTSHGEITPMHVGLMGTMSQMYLADLAKKTKRGLWGRVSKGRSGGGLGYGYRILDDGSGPGLRQIDETEAAIVRRIFAEAARGESPRAIAKKLNAERVPGPKGRKWGDTTIRGQADRGTGILNNELYRGELVWNRCSYVKNPATGKRVSRPNSPESWEREPVPELRIIDEELWQAVKERQAERRFVMGRNEDGQALNRAHRTKFLLSGLLKCGGCGGGLAIVSRHRYGCVAHRNRGTCDNDRTVAREEAERRILDGLRSRLLTPEMFEAFAEDYAQEIDASMKQQGQHRERLEAELVGIDRKIEGILRAIEDGMYQPSMKARMTDLEQRKATIQAELASAAPSQPVRLHPNLPALYTRQVGRLEELLAHPELGREAMEAIRALIEKIVVTPEPSGVSLELHGDLAAILAIAEHGTNKNARRVAGGCSGDVRCAVSVVAGVGFEPTTFRL